MKVLDRILTIVITATITSVVWIVAGGSLIENATSESQRKATRPAEVVPSPTASDASPGIAQVVDDNAGLDAAAPTVPAEDGPRQLMVPVLNIRPDDLSDTFSDSVSKDGGVRLHEAIDILAPIGTSVVAAAPGTVEKLFRSRAGGNTIYVRSSDGKTIYYYAHLDKYAEGLQEGQRVRRGQRLGSVGASGNASKKAPHLHFAILQTTADAEWWEPANAVNPYSLLTGE